MVVVEEIGQCQLHATIFCKGSHAGHKPCRVAVGSTDVIQYVLRRFLLQLNIAALGNGHKAILDFAAHTSCSVRQQRRKFILKIVLSVCLADEVQYGQAFLIFGQTQAAAQLLQENR